MRGRRGFYRQNLNVEIGDAEARQREGRERPFFEVGHRVVPRARSYHEGQGLVLLCVVVLDIVVVEENGGVGGQSRRKRKNHDSKNNNV